MAPPDRIESTPARALTSVPAREGYETWMDSTSITAIPHRRGALILLSDLRAAALVLEPDGTIRSAVVE